MKNIGFVALLLVVIGGLNWGLVGLLNMNLVTTLFGEEGVLTQAVYVLVGVSAVYVGATLLPKQMSK
ncbi:MAG: DUF378 domain-containing protein [Candidatus Yanofskybacteria bacterium]|nr:DUF378 domain-containing protein [Candidatus Yanofskybacteria bacterium]